MISQAEAQSGRQGLVVRARYKSKQDTLGRRRLSFLNESLNSIYLRIEYPLLNLSLYRLLVRWG